MHNSVWVDRGGSQLDTHPDTIGAVASVLSSFLGTGSIYQLYLWSFDGFQQSIDSIDQLVISFLGQPMLGEKLLSTSFLGLNQFPIKVWKVLNLADRIQCLWVRREVFGKKTSSSILIPKGISNCGKLSNRVLPGFIPEIQGVVSL